MIDLIANEIKDAEKRNSERWKTKADVLENSNNYNSEIFYIKNFLSNRIKFLDEYINYPPLLKIGNSYAFINEKQKIIFCSLPENSKTIQKITWEFDEILRFI